MIVIKASGSQDVRELKKLARTLRADETHIHLDQPDPEPKRRKPTVNPQFVSRLTPATHDAILELSAKPENDGPGDR